MTWLELMNLLFEAHRNKDVVTERILLDELADIEPTYADTLDIVYKY